MYLSEQEFTKLRVQRVRAAASVFDLLEAEGHPPRTRARSAQMKCVFGATYHKREDTKPSARYYPAGERDDYETYYCFYCTEQPLDAIHLLMRLKGMRFYDALRHLEHQHGVKYDDIEVAQDLDKEIKDLAAKARIIDPGPVFEYCERFLKEHRDTIGKTRFIVLSRALDLIYYKHDDNKPADTVARLERWKGSASKIVNKGIDNASVDTAAGSATPSEEG
jgi:hypothetical protein